MTKGDIVLIPFPFTDLTGNKLRPAVILVAGQVDLTVCFITAQLKWQEESDIQLQPNNINGVKRVSLIRLSKIATIEKSLVQGLLGNLSANELLELNRNLKQLFQLS